MLFNSLDFAIFLPVVFLLYWFATQFNLRVQNVLLLIASYVFYGWWDWRFLSLIILSTLIDFFVGRRLGVESSPSKRKFLLWVSILANLGMLGFFKYFDFFMENFTAAFSLFGGRLDSWSLKLLLPVGISFYTFQTLSYTIDVYKKTIKPTKDIIAFAAFVSFFPQLVAGPIERAKNLLPQFFTKRNFDYHQATEGLKQILWGLFKKMVIADNCAEYVDMVFGNPDGHSASVLLVGAILFAFQIYGDFSGYSDIAIGTARLFGFRLMQNFAYPYFSRDMAEFWRRWHISLSTWFRDYVYIPLGGSRGNKVMQIRNIFIVFLVSGFWHGANWTFIFWGGLNAVFFLPLLLRQKNRQHIEVVALNQVFPSFRETGAIISTFLLTVFAWIFFRAASLADAFRYIFRMMDQSLLSWPRLDLSMSTRTLGVMIMLMLGVEWYARKREFGLSFFASSKPQVLRWLFYAFLIACIGMYMQTRETSFIYFQF